MDKEFLIAIEPELLEAYLAQHSHNSLYCRQIRQVDKLFDYFEELRKKVLNELANDPKKFIPKIWHRGSPLSRDWKCQLKMGKDQPSLEERLKNRRRNLTREKFFKCEGCQLIQVLTSLKEATSGLPFSPACGRNKDQEFTIFLVNNLSLKSYKELDQRSLITEIRRENSLAEACQPNLALLQEIDYYAFDSFSNRILIDWVLDDIFVQKGLPHVRKIFYPFICNDDGYLLLEHKSYKSISQLRITNSNQVWSILYQLFAIFHCLKEHDLSFREINEDTIIFEETSCDYQYDDMNITGSLTLKLNDLSRAGITLVQNKIRIFSAPDTYESSFARNPKGTMKWVRQYELARSPGERLESWVSYIVNEAPDLNGFLYTNRMGLPLYQSSFDIYRFMILFFTNDQFHHFMINDRHLHQIWKSFWLITDYEILMDRLNKNELSLNKTLMGLHLRCNIVNHIWNQLKTEAYGRSNYVPYL